MTPTELIAAAREGIAKFNGAPNHVVEGLIAALEAQMWRPIDYDTPRDGAVILLWNGFCELGFWNGRSWNYGDFHDKLSNGFTHWKPLDAPEAKP